MYRYFQIICALFFLTCTAFAQNEIDHINTLWPSGYGKLATIGNNIFASDYYSLQHLRWGAPTAVDCHDIPSQPTKFTLMQNYPNPFNAQTTINYEVPSAGDVTLSIYNILGERVDLINAGYQASGSHALVWDSKGLGSGLYFYQLRAGHTNMIKKMMLLK
jgi:hypothetical protein